jgi:hypothetical protein
MTEKTTRLEAFRKWRGNAAKEFLYVCALMFGYDTAAGRGCFPDWVFWGTVYLAGGLCVLALVNLCVYGFPLLEDWNRKDEMVED